MYMLTKNVFYDSTKVFLFGLMVEEIYLGKFFMHVLDRSILQKSKRLMTSLKFVIRPLIFKLLKSTRYP